MTFPPFDAAITVTAHHELAGPKGGGRRMPPALPVPAPPCFPWLRADRQGKGK